MAKSIVIQDQYVYIHRRKTDGSVFYVGKGVKRRAWSKDNRNIYWHRTAKKYGYTVEIVQDGMQAWWALEREQELVTFYGRENLVNLTDGGDGILNASEETRRKISASKKGVKPSPEVVAKRAAAMVGTKRSEETKRRIAEGQRGNKRESETGAKIRAANLGRVTSEETKKKLSAIFKGRTISEEHKKRIKEFWTGRKHKPESIEKMRIAKANVVVSDEARAKLSAMRKGVKRKPESIEKTAAAHRGMKRSEETCLKMVIAAQNRSAEHRAKISAANKGRKQTPEQKEKKRLKMLEIWAERKRLKALNN